MRPRLIVIGLSIASATMEYPALSTPSTAAQSSKPTHVGVTDVIRKDQQFRAEIRKGDNRRILVPARPIPGVTHFQDRLPKKGVLNSTPVIDVRSEIESRHKTDRSVHLKAPRKANVQSEHSASDGCQKGFEVPITRFSEKERRESIGDFGMRLQRTPKNFTEEELKDVPIRPEIEK